uniref:ERCC4 domain-containing protein n=1 Tax=viral metagenome TaxID=1070528 RepID=A0A6C0B537_9ZZZZ
MKIIVDEREASLYALLTQQPHNDKKPKIEKRVLPLGDILFTSDDESITHQVIERKSVADLLASVKDGRYAEQSYRLGNCFPNRHNILYLIEGSVRDHDKKLVFACMASLNYFKGFSITRTVSLAETAQYIEITADKIARELEKGTSVSAAPLPASATVSADTTVTPSDNVPNVEVQQATSTFDYCSVVKVAKKANITRDNIGQLMLMQIPGISSTISGEIMRPFATFAAFIDHLRAEPAYLDTIVLESSGKKRKLGSNIIAAIRDYLL